MPPSHAGTGPVALQSFHQAWLSRMYLLAANRLAAVNAPGWAEAVARYPEFEIGRLQLAAGYCL